MGNFIIKYCDICGKRLEPEEIESDADFSDEVYCKKCRPEQPKKKSIPVEQKEETKRIKSKNYKTSSTRVSRKRKPVRKKTPTKQKKMKNMFETEKDNKPEDKTLFIIAGVGGLVLLLAISVIIFFKPSSKEIEKIKTLNITKDKKKDLKEGIGKIKKTKKDEKKKKTIINKKPKEVIKKEKPGEKLYKQALEYEKILGSNYSEKIQYWKRKISELYNTEYESRARNKLKNAELSLNQVATRKYNTIKDSTQSLCKNREFDKALALWRNFPKGLLNQYWREKIIKEKEIIEKWKKVSQNRVEKKDILLNFIKNKNEKIYIFKNQNKMLKPNKKIGNCLVEGTKIILKKNSFENKLTGIIFGKGFYNFVLDFYVKINSGEVAIFARTVEAKGQKSLLPTLVLTTKEDIMNPNKVLIEKGKWYHYYVIFSGKKLMHTSSKKEDKIGKAELNIETYKGPVGFGIIKEGEVIISNVILYPAKK